MDNTIVRRRSIDLTHLPLGPGQRHGLPTDEPRPPRPPIPAIAPGTRVYNMTDDQLRFLLDPQLHITSYAQAREAALRLDMIVQDINAQIDRDDEGSSPWRNRAVAAIARIRAKRASLQVWMETLERRDSDVLALFHAAATQVLGDETLERITDKMRDLKRERDNA